MKKVIMVTNCGTKEVALFEEGAKKTYLKKPTKVKCITFAHKEVPTSTAALAKKKKPEAVIFDKGVSTATIITTKHLIEQKMNGKSPSFIHISQSKVLQIPTVKTHADAFDLL